MEILSSLRKLQTHCVWGISNGASWSSCTFSLFIKAGPCRRRRRRRPRASGAAAEDAAAVAAHLAADPQLQDERAGAAAATGETNEYDYSKPGLGQFFGTVNRL